MEIGILFEWDSGNVEKVTSHGVSIDEIEMLIRNNPLVLRDHKHSHTEDRYIAIGKVFSRSVFCVLTIRDRGEKSFVRIFSARYMHQEEVLLYEELQKRDRANPFKG